jgi:hypothetical protein
MYIPLLPYRSGGKLTFPLCRTCVENSNNPDLLNRERCTHSDEQRALTDTWVSVEVVEALKENYKIVKIFEVWHFEQSEQYDPITKTGGIFTDYIKMAIKVKQESSGYPRGCDSDEQKQAYIDEYYQHEGKLNYKVNKSFFFFLIYLILKGILLNKDNIEKNPGMRFVSKLWAVSV